MKNKNYRVTVSLLKSKGRNGEYSYCARFYDACGKRPQFSLKGMNKIEAKQAAHKLEQQVNEPDVVNARKNGITYAEFLKKSQDLAESKRITIKDLCTEHLELVKNNSAHKTWVMYEIAYRQLQLFLIKNGVNYLDELTYPVMESYKSHMLVKYVASTVATKLNSLYGLIEYGKKLGFISSNPLKELDKINIPESEIRTFTEDERNKLLAAVKDDRPGYYIMLLVAFDTAARFNELTSIVKKSDFRFEVDAKTKVEFGVMSITNRAVRTKNKRNRYTPIKPATVKILKQYLANFNDDELPFQKVDLSKGVFFKQYLKKAGLDPTYHFHMIRKTALSALADSGISILKLCEIAGHSSIETSRKYYLKKNSEDIAREIALLVEEPRTLYNVTIKNNIGQCTQSA